MAAGSGIPRSTSRPSARLEEVNDLSVQEDVSEETCVAKFLSGLNQEEDRLAHAPIVPFTVVAPGILTPTDESGSCNFCP